MCNSNRSIVPRLRNPVLDTKQGLCFAKVETNNADTIGKITAPRGKERKKEKEVLGFQSLPSTRFSTRDWAWKRQSGQIQFQTRCLHDKGIPSHPGSFYEISPKIPAHPQSQRVETCPRWAEGLPSGTSFRSPAFFLFICSLPFALINWICLGNSKSQLQKSPSPPLSWQTNDFCAQ